MEHQKRVNYQPTERFQLGKYHLSLEIRARVLLPNKKIIFVLHIGHQGECVWRSASEEHRGVNGHKIGQGPC